MIYEERADTNTRIPQHDILIGYDPNLYKVASYVRFGERPLGQTLQKQAMHGRRFPPKVYLAIPDMAFRKCRKKMSH